MASVISDFDEQIKQVAVDVKLRDTPSKPDNTYRRTVTITNSGGALTNELICIPIDHFKLILQKKCSSTFNDLRVYDTDLTTELDFYVESPGYIWTKIFIRVPSIGASTTKDIYLEYGNQTLVNRSNSDTIDEVLGNGHCLNWLKASQLTRTDYLTRHNKLYNSTVRIWDDVSKTGKKFIVPNELSRPSFWLDKDRNPAVRFTGGQSLKDFSYDNNKVTPGNDWEIFSVTQPNWVSSETAPRVVVGQLRAISAPGNYDAIQVQYISGTRVGGGYYYNDTYGSITSYSPDNKYVHNVVHDSNNDAGYGVARITNNLNGATISSNTTVQTLAFNNQLVIGARAQPEQDFFQGLIYEVLVFGGRFPFGNLSATQRANIQKYLNLKHNLNTSSYPTVSVGSESNITITKTYTSFYPLVDKVEVRKKLSKEWHGYEIDQTKITILNLLKQTLLVGTDTENWSGSNLDETGDVIGQYCRSILVTNSGITDTAVFDRTVTGTNIHDLSEFHLENQLTSTTYTSTDDDFICLDFWIQDHTRLDLSASYIQFENSSGTKSKTGYLDDNINGLITGRNTIKIRKSDFVGSGSPNWSEVSHTVNIYLESTSNTTAKYGWLRLEIDNSRLFTLGSEIQIVTNVSSDSGTTWASDVVYEGIVDSVNSTTEDWSFEVLDRLQTSLETQFFEPPSEKRGFLTLPDHRSNQEYDVVSLLNTISPGDNLELYAKMGLDTFGDGWVLGANVERVEEIEDPDGNLSGSAYSFRYNSSSNATIQTVLFYNSGVPSQEFKLSVYLKLISGTTSNFDKIGIDWYNAGPTVLASSDSASLTLTSSWQRFELTATWQAGFIIVKLPSNMNGAVIGIAWPQLAVGSKIISSRPTLGLNGTSNYASIPHANSLSVTGNLTVMAWVRPTNFTNFNTIAAKTVGIGTANNTYEFRIEKTTGRLQFIRRDTTLRVLVSTTALTAGVWSHVAVVRNGTNVTFYINGISAGTGTVGAGVSTSNTSPVFIGQRNDLNAVTWYNGRISHVNIFNTALTATQIGQYLAVRLNGNENNLVYSEPLDQGVGTSMTDSTGNHTTSLVGYTNLNNAWINVRTTTSTRPSIDWQVKLPDYGLPSYVLDLVSKVDYNFKFFELLQLFWSHYYQGIVMTKNNVNFSKLLDFALINYFGILSKHQGVYRLTDWERYLKFKNVDPTFIDPKYVYSFIDQNQKVKKVRSLNIAGNTVVDIKEDATFIFLSGLGDAIERLATKEISYKEDDYNKAGVGGISGVKLIDPVPGFNYYFVTSMTAPSIPAGDLALGATPSVPLTDYRVEFGELIMEYYNSNSSDRFLFSIFGYASVGLVANFKKDNLAYLLSIDGVDFYFRENAFELENFQAIKPDVVSNNNIVLNNEFSSFGLGGNAVAPWNTQLVADFLNLSSQTKTVKLVIDYRYTIVMGNTYRLYDENNNEITFTVIAQDFIYNKNRHEQVITGLVI